MKATNATPIQAIYDLGISHNKFGTPLPDGTPYPEYAAEVKGKRALEFLTHFDRVRDRDWAECSFLDLGCAEGSTTFELSQMGSSAYGIEGREDGIHRAEVIKTILGFEKTYFDVANVNDPTAYRAVDGLFNAGTLYHLEDPIACLERCAKSSRLFVYLDTNHAPRNEEEMEKSKYAGSFRETFTIRYKGVQIDAINVGEPKNTAEIQAGGLRRPPRSGIGNTNSVWLSHGGAVALMKKLGFPHFEVIYDNPKFPRLRTCFFRVAPKPLEGISELRKPLPKLLPPDEAMRLVRERDIAYLRRVGKPVLLLGREPMLSLIARELADLSIPVSERIELPEEPPAHRGLVDKITRGRTGMVVVAAPDVINIIRHLPILNRFQYAFGSFAMLRAKVVTAWR